jgi:hypothetical protein
MSKEDASLKRKVEDNDSNLPSKKKMDLLFAGCTASDEEDVEYLRRNYSNGYPRVDLTRLGCNEKLNLTDKIDFKSKEGTAEYRRQCALIEEKNVESTKDSFLQNTNLYIEQLKKERSELEKRHMEKVTLLRQEKKVLEEGVANLNEKI